MNMFLLSIVAFLFAIGVLVAVHEWGHYIVARMAGVKVLRFSIGFGKIIWSRRAGPDQTEYCLSAIPLGGYVKLLDEREGEVPVAELGRAFNRIAIHKRIAILVAGPLMNFIFAILAFWCMYTIGVPGVQPIVGEVQSATIAAEAGLQAEDRIVVVGSQSVSTWEGTMLEILDQLLSDDKIRMEVIRADGTDHTVYLDIAGKVSQLTEPGALFSGLGLIPWSPTLEPILEEIVPGGTAESAGLLSGDRIISAAGQPIDTWSQWVEYLRSRPGQDVELLIERASQQQLVLLAIGEAQLEDGTVIGRIGVSPKVPDDLYDRYAASQRYSFFEALPVGIERTWTMSMLTIRMVSRIVTGDVSVKNIGGPINIAQYAGYSASIGVAAFLNFLAVVSLSLGILNLLPVPVLDGGQVLYQLLEALKGSPLSAQAELVGQQIGVIFLMLLMGFAFYNDLSRVLS
jgi:regulator of sigma E protease